MCNELPIPPELEPLLEKRTEDERREQPRRHDDALPEEQQCSSAASYPERRAVRDRRTHERRGDS